ncbi:hypothetical protein E1B28_004142 [Marasmius oreades]|uniref:Uncharacterized protein n=1 Tax=Marasmius oreades TaxID=181124 RepID=A0A9P7UXY3_9AGAR|nr:uncharacterized protein E1B28_004142 [Marasmius oreades]KAG7096729.1 hypothetical protein E1B28_004142 [Marasmius oreades]
MSRSPLQELPLSRVPLPPTPLTATRSTKRPFAPDSPSLFSPTKRRILSEEGLLSDNTLKSPFHIRETLTSRPAQANAEPSPAKKLDFGASKIAKTSVTGDRLSKPPSVAPSPQLPRTPYTPSCTSNARTPLSAVDDFFSTPERLASSSHSKNPPRIVPRPLPACSDPHSVHYPGFRVYRDPHIIIPDPIDPGLFMVRTAKENLPPRRSMKKAATEPVRNEDNGLLLTPESKKRELEKMLKAKSTPATPRKIAGKERSEHTSPTPQRPAVPLGGRPWVGTPSLTEEDRRERRRLMMEEVEDGDNGIGFADL